MAEEVHADEPVRHAGEKEAVKGKTGSFIEKHKEIVYGGVALVIVVLFFLLRGSGSSSASQTAATNAAAEEAADQAALSSEPVSGGGGGGWSPSGVASAGGSTSVASTPGPAGPAGPAGPPGNGLVQLTFAQAEKLAGKSGSSALYYSDQGKIVQGKYANDKNVTYYTTAPEAIKIGAL
jgi:hypothetical protein